MPEGITLVRAKGRRDVVSVTDSINTLSDIFCAFSSRAAVFPDLPLWIVLASDYLERQITKRKLSVRRGATLYPMFSTILPSLIKFHLLLFLTSVGITPRKIVDKHHTSAVFPSYSP